MLISEKRNADSNPAQDRLVPNDPAVFRTAFLYVGQGDASLHIVPDGSGGRLYVLVDINLDKERNGTDVVTLLEDLLPEVDGRPTLDLYISTHPHSDHIRGIDEITERIRVKQVWRTGFEPGKAHEDRFQNFKDFLAKVKQDGGDVYEYQGTRAEVKFGEVSVEILSPAEHVKEEIDKLSGEERYNRIHEYCGVFRFGYGQKAKHVLQPGDADRDAWEGHILNNDYHKDRLPSVVLNASHHGSCSFFYNGDPNNEEPYTRALEIIDPNWVVISSPTQEDSPHNHPHDAALELYEGYVGKENVLVLGENRECIIYDIYKDGNDALYSDRGELADRYQLGEDLDGGDEGKASSVYIGTKIDSGRSMG